MKSSIKDNANGIVRCLRSKNLKDITLRNLISECQVSDDREFYSRLKLLASENKIMFLVTPADTYVLPLVETRSMCVNADY
jgi:hypothetical protein